MTSDRKNQLKSSGKNRHDSESPSSDEGDYSSSALESSQNPASIIKQHNHQKPLQMDRN